MVLPQSNTGIFVGLNKGHIVRKTEFSPPDLPAEKVNLARGFIYQELDQGSGLLCPI
ncbi:unnamed protein product [Musa hybrid cultivar]